MFVNVKGNRIDLSEVVRYSSYEWQNENKGTIYFYFKATDKYLDICFQNKEELHAVVDYLDKYNNVRELQFFPEKEKAKLVITEAKDKKD